MTIWKFPVYITDHQAIHAPEGARPLKVMLQNGQPYVWMLVDPTKPKRDYPIRVYGTDHEIPDGLGLYCDSFMVHADALVFHVFFPTLEEVTT